MRRANRRYILEQIATKVNESVPVFKKEENEQSYADSRMVSLALWRWQFHELYELPSAYSTQVHKTGRELVTGELDSQIFRLLREAERGPFRNAIREFMHGNDEIFSTCLFPDIAVHKKFRNAEDLVQRTKGSKYFEEIYTKLRSRKPDRVSKDEIKVRESAYEEAKSAFEHELKTVNSARIALHNAMERMVAELTDLP